MQKHETLVIPIDWESGDISAEDLCVPATERGAPTYTVSAAELRAMDDGQFIAFYEYVTGRKRKVA